MATVLPIASENSADCGLSPTRAEPAEFNTAAHGLRGVASLMVLGAHIIGGTARHIYPHDISYVRAVEHPWYLGGFGVELFFIISGFVILPSALKYSTKEFALRRFLRIYPLFFILSVIFVALNVMTNAYPRENNLESIISGFLFINLFSGTEQLTPNAWSLSFEAVFYILTATIVYFMVKRPNALLLACSLLAALAFLIAFPISIYFLLGVGVRLYQRRTMPPLALARTLEVICLLLTIYLGSRAHYEYHLADLADPVIVPTIVSTALYFWLAVTPNSLTGVVLGNRFCSYVGTVSYSLYLVHPYIYYSIRQLFVHRGWFTNDVAQSMLLFAIPVVVVSFAAAHLVHVTLERAPYKWFFRRRLFYARLHGSS